MSFKGKIMAVGATLTGITRNALAAGNGTHNVEVDISKGQANFMALQYADKAQWILDTLGYIVNLAAVAVVLYCALKILFGGWGDLESELKGRRGLVTAILAILGMKLGLMLINLIINW